MSLIKDVERFFCDTHIYIHTCITYLRYIQQKKKKKRAVKIAARKKAGIEWRQCSLLRNPDDNERITYQETLTASG